MGKKTTLIGVYLTHVSAGTKYPVAFGYGSYPETTEALMDVDVHLAFTWSNLWLYCETFSATETVVRTRINAVSGNLQININGTGEFSDIVNTDSVSIGNDINYMSTQTGTGSTTVIQLRSDIETADTTNYDLLCGIYCSHAADNYIGLNYTDLSENATKESIRFNATAKSLRLNVFSNPTTLESIVYTRIAGVNGSPHIHIAAGTTGDFADDINTASITAGNIVNLFLDIGSANTIMFTGYIDLQNTVKTILFSNGYIAFSTSGTVSSNVVGGFSSASLYFETGHAGLIQKASTSVYSNSETANRYLTVYKNGSSTSVSIQITAGGTGIYEDTTNSDAVVGTDQLKWIGDRLTALKAITVYVSKLELYLTSETISLSEGSFVRHITGHPFKAVQARRYESPAVRHGTTPNRVWTSKKSVTGTFSLSHIQSKIWAAKKLLTDTSIIRHTGFPIKIWTAKKSILEPSIIRHLTTPLFVKSFKRVISGTANLISTYSKAWSPKRSLTGTFNILHSSYPTLLWGAKKSILDTGVLRNKVPTGVTTIWTTFKLLTAGNIVLTNPVITRNWMSYKILSGILTLTSSLSKVWSIIRLFSGTSNILDYNIKSSKVSIRNVLIISASYNRMLAFIRSITQALDIRDRFVRTVWTVFRGFSNAVNLIDLFSSYMGDFIAMTTESMNMTHIPFDTISSFKRVLTQTVNVLAPLTRKVTYIRPYLETLNILAALSKVFTVKRYNTEALSLLSVYSRIWTNIYKTFLQNIILIGYFGKSSPKILVDSISIQSNISNKPGFVRRYLDSLLIGSSVARFQIYKVIINSSVLGDILSRAGTIYYNLTNSMNLIASKGRNWTIPKIFNQTFAITASLSKIWGIALKIPSTLVIGESFAYISQILKTLLSIIHITDSVDRTFNAILPIIETSGISSTLKTKWDSVIKLISTITLTNPLTTFIHEWLREILDSINLYDSKSLIAGTIIGLLDTLNMTDLVDRITESYTSLVEDVDLYGEFGFTSPSLNREFIELVILEGNPVPLFIYFYETILTDFMVLRDVIQPSKILSLVNTIVIRTVDIFYRFVPLSAELIVRMIGSTRMTTKMIRDFYYNQLKKRFVGDEE